MHLTLADGPMLVADFGAARRVLSSAVLGGGLGTARGWLNATVERDYGRLDPAADLVERAARIGLRGPLVGMLTAVDVRRRQQAMRGYARVVATVGVGHALAAAGTRLRAVPPVGTINLLVLVDAPLDDAALVGALQTAVEAKVQALAAARVPAANASSTATGTATDAICVAALPGGGVPFAGPATRVGADLAHAVFQAVHAGALADAADRARRAERASSTRTLADAADRARRADQADRTRTLADAADRARRADQAVHVGAPTDAERPRRAAPATPTPTNAEHR